ncbi:MAG: orotidine 5'-phosphate decarboxylase [Thaumarchaeota archaeon]|jgi:orotidine-5'-phosphate decarboxylase|nr:orotidine 5'-phosphate decarboxylase [Nitrososphaerota archaeon]MBT4675215.1 orotidine 5'-phosphate decarboxylase [Nitrososphaerota archaeon]MBT5238823.1 orotidine 5'-phosphate decarboxylase [Nitrososphaerota archaeon]MBT6172084.1 orotidine 5'-phosphate decarboxylase [Nitrososphaerota archaeon]MBT6370272.1 orotidine 5'-phosphate decarboxylase [Nitrososphaerota archaeon]
MTKFSDRIKKSAKTSPIILANDYDPKIPNIESKTLRNIKLLNNYLCGIKINFHLLLQLDKKQISRINKNAHDYGLQCIADIKLNDIGNTNFITAENLWNMGFDAVIVNPIMGKKSLKNLVELSHKKNKGVISLCHMSAPEAKISYELEIKNNSKKQQLYQLFLDWALTSHVDGIIVGATYPKIISYCKKSARGKLSLFSPGIGTQGGSASKAKKLGSDYLIVGRTILNSKNPVETTKKLVTDSII